MNITPNLNGTNVQFLISHITIHLEEVVHSYTETISYKYSPYEIAHIVIAWSL